MTPLNYLNRNRDFVLIAIANLALAIAAFSSAYHNSPLLDEPAHFASGVILAQYADGSWILWLSTQGWTSSRRLLCIALWCTSPLVLGDGSVVSADAPSGVAMCLILWMTVRLWHHPSLVGFALSGLAWGLAIGTKFTFGPLWNIRYLILGLPLVYVSVAALLPSVLSLSHRTSRTGSSDPFVYALIAVMAFEFACNYPYHFSYINPIFGGSPVTVDCG
jgi:hypothetical protein